MYDSTSRQVEDWVGLGSPFSYIYPIYIRYFMKHLNFCLICLSISYFSFGQTNNIDCKCPLSMYSGRKADTIFFLPNKFSIALCGYKDTGIIKGRVLYREFVLSVCGSNKIIKFWGAMQVCHLKTMKDTVIVESLVDLPVGKYMRYKETVWTIEHIYFVKGKIVRDSVINLKLPKYSQSQISNVLSLYNHSPDANNDNTSELADKLFISTISNSKKAKNYLINFRNKFTNLDGVYLEEYDTIIRMLKLWEENNH